MRSVSAIGDESDSGMKPISLEKGKRRGKEGEGAARIRTNAAAGPKEKYK